MNTDVKNLIEAYSKIRTTKHVLSEASTTVKTTPILDLLNEAGKHVMGPRKMRGASDSQLMADSNLHTWSGKALVAALGTAYTGKDPLLIYGDPGIGKSSIVKRFAMSVAKKRKKPDGGTREFRIWNDVSQAEKVQIINNAEKYFVLMDVRVVNLEPSDIQGVPVMIQDVEWLSTKKNDWMVFLSKQNADGILFLDEINQGSPGVLNAFMQVVLDRNFNGVPISQDVAIVAACNMPSQGNVMPLRANLIDRFSAGILILHPEEWLEYARQAGLNDNILAFVESEPDKYFYQVPGSDKTNWQDDTKFVTPRTLETLSREIGHIDQEFDEYIANGQTPPLAYEERIEDVVKARCGKNWGEDFLNFLEYVHLFRLEDIVGDPERFATRALKDNIPGKAEKDFTWSLGRVYCFTNWLANQVAHAYKEVGGDLTKLPNYKLVYEAFWSGISILQNDWRTVLLTCLRSKIGDIGTLEVIVTQTSALFKGDQKRLSMIQPILAQLKKDGNISDIQTTAPPKEVKKK